MQETNNLGKQERHYLQIEADSYFDRNKEIMDTPTPGIVKNKKGILQLLERASIKPTKILEVGGSTGFFLNDLQKTFNCPCVGVEPSKKAVDYGNQTYPNIKMHQGVASDLGIAETGEFDLIVLNGVFCWIGREELLRSVAEIDRALKEGGHLVISDYLPEFATMNKNKHVTDADIYCYKMDYAKLFLDTHLYTIVEGESYFNEHEKFDGNSFDTRHFTVVLRKSYADYYRRGT